MTKSRKQAYIALIIVALIWGIAGPMIKYTMGYLPPFTALFYRFSITLCISAPLYFWYLRSHNITNHDLITLSIDGLFSTTLHLGLLFLGYSFTSALEGSLLSALRPMFIVLLGIIFLHDIVTKREKIGLLFIIGGTIFTVFQPLFNNSVPSFQHVLGNFFIILSGLSWAIFIVLAKKSAKKYSPLLLTLHASIVAFISFFLLAIIEQGGIIPLYLPLASNPYLLFALVYLALVSYFVGYYLYEYGVMRIEVSEAAVFEFLAPLFAIPIALIWLHEHITLPYLIGAFLITIGVVLNEWK
jgi:drug/metabolite transporter (DMT)-like permease